MWLDSFHHPLLLERIYPHIYRVDLEQLPYSCFDNYVHPPGSNVHLLKSSNKSDELVSIYEVAIFVFQLFLATFYKISLGRSL